MAKFLSYIFIASSLVLSYFLLFTNHAADKGGGGGDSSSNSRSDSSSASDSSPETAGGGAASGSFLLPGVAATNGHGSPLEGRDRHHMERAGHIKRDLNHCWRRYDGYNLQNTVVNKKEQLKKPYGILCNFKCTWFFTITYPTCEFIYDYKLSCYLFTSLPDCTTKNKKKNHQHAAQQQQQQQQQQKIQQQQQQQNKENLLTENFDKLKVTEDSNQHKENGNTNLLNGNENAPYTIAMSEIYGRYLVARRDLKPGEILISEKPLAIGPCVSADAVCLGCYMPVNLKPTQYRCPTCRWPLCSAQCKGLNKESGHSERECQLFKSENTCAPLFTQPAPTPAQIRNLYELVLIVRILLMKQHAPELFARIMLMESHMEMRKKNPELWRHYESNVVTYLRENWHLAEQFTSEEIHMICGILDVNCFEIGQNLAKARTLYPSAFLLAHDCCPNTSHTDDPRTYDIILRTSRAIRKGEAITLSYAYTLQGTLKRRDFMQAGKLFWCCCKRCADPYELGSDCSAIICGQCKKGLIRSTKPLDQEAEWKCDKCPFTLTSKEIVKLLDRINNDLESIDAHDVPGLEKFLKRYDSILGPNHYLLLSAKYSLCQIYGKIEGYLLPCLTLEDLKRKEKYCRDFLEVIDKLEPGLTRLRGLIMYELHAPIMMISQYCMSTGTISRRDFNSNIKEVVKLLKESSLILKMEPEGSNEYQMGVAAEESLQKMGF